MTDSRPHLSSRSASADDILGLLLHDKKAPSRVDVMGTAGGAQAFLVARLARAAGSAVAVAPDEGSSRRLAADVRYFVSEIFGDSPPRVLRYPEHDLPAGSPLKPDRRNELQRLAVMAHLMEDGPYILVVPAGALTRRIIPKEAFNAWTQQVEVSGELDRDAFVAALAAARYRQAPLVEDKGTYALRGALVDVFPPAAKEPFRIELDGDLIWRIRTFDPETQLTTGGVDLAAIPPAGEAIRGEEELACALDRIRQTCDAVNFPSARTKDLLEGLEAGSSLLSPETFLPAFHDELDTIWRYVSQDAAVLIEEPEHVVDAWCRIEESTTKALEDSFRDGQPSLPVSDYLAPWKGAREQIEGRKRILSFAVPVESTALWSAVEPLDLGAESNDGLSRKLRDQAASRGASEGFEPLRQWLREKTEINGGAVRVVARSAGQAERLASMIRTEDLHAELWPEGPGRQKPGSIQVVVGELSRGFSLAAENRAWVAEEEILGRRSRRRRKSKASEAFEDLSALEIGQKVVHVEHGVGHYLGLARRQVAGLELEFLLIEYLGGDKLYLPVYRLNQIHRYIGGETAKLDKLGGQTFSRKKKKARKAAEDLADQLLKVQAARQAIPGVACDGPDSLYTQLEASFPYDETPEQQRAIDEVVQDLESERAMDRVVCGDVGFGKTEVAVRAAFRMVLSGRQVAVLVPTTVLAQQHYLTFLDRLSNFPVVVDVLSRFRTGKQQTALLGKLKSGQVDIVVGTHRLLSKDVHFRNLGLLIIDEEHRFGVEHKERIKRIKTHIDVLTLSATPIPRTLQMAMSSLRDLSLITTPPEGRRPIRTYVTKHDDRMIQDAIQRELARGGQVFYVRNRVAGLRDRADHLASLLPEARFVVGHGQMQENKLEEVMVEFVEGRADVLVCTTIVESGLDVPRANTVIIERADHFGLAQLYHIRGRVGRSSERAYAYLLVPPSSEMTEDGRRRIAAIQKLSELGSGFALATLDMEIRGAGELLGLEQSGQVAEVGYQMYVELLEEAVSELRGEPAPDALDPELSFDVPGFVPELHVPDTGQRLVLYQRLAGAKDDYDVDDVASEMRDRFGHAPDQLENLFRMMKVKAAARRLAAAGVEGSTRHVTIHLSERTPLEPEQVLELVTKKGSRYRVTPDMRLRCRLAEGEHRDGIEAAQNVVSELLGMVPTAQKAPVPGG